MFKTVHSPQTIAWYYFTVIASVIWTVQLDHQDIDIDFLPISDMSMSWEILVTYNVMLIALAYSSSAVTLKGHRSRRSFN